jgi:hypothetical protein
MVIALPAAAVRTEKFRQKTHEERFQGWCAGSHEGKPDFDC